MHAIWWDAGLPNDDECESYASSPTPRIVALIQDNPKLIAFVANKKEK